MKDKLGNEIQLYHQVIVPEPHSEDVHQHSFIGTVVDFFDWDNKVCVEDNDSDLYKIKPERLTVVKE